MKFLMSGPNGPVPHIPPSCERRSSIASWVIQRLATLKPMALAVMLMTGAINSHAQSATELMQELQQLRQEMQRMRTELEAIKQSQAMALQDTPNVTSRSVAQETTATPAAPQASENRVSLFGYGEMLYTRPWNDASQAMATARRGVLGFAYRFNDRTRFAAELEVENAVVSASDQGEVAFEQLYVEHDIDDQLTAKAGLFLLPIGYMNETHEPTRYFGVTRNLVETAIIPTTWREMGLGLRGRTPEGWRWDAGLVTSFDLTKWPKADASDTKASPLGAIHQEGQLAKAASWAYYGALNYDGVPGVNVGGSWYSGGIGQQQASIPTPNASVTLAELHAKWQVGRWDLSTLAAQGNFQGVAAFNAAGVSGTNPVPDEFRGWYTQAAYRLWRSGDQSVVPFVRYENVNTAVGFSGLAQGLTPSTDPDTRVVTLGASYYLHPQVVFKIDTQRYLNNSNLDRLNLGVGFHY